MRRIMILFLVSVFQILFSSNDLYASSSIRRENRGNHTEMYVEGYNLKKSNNIGANSSSVYYYDRYFENAKPVLDSIPSILMACFTQRQELEGLLTGRLVCHLQIQSDGTIAGIVFSTEEQYAGYLTDRRIEAMTNAIKDKHFASFTFTDYVMVSIPITSQVITERYNTFSLSSCSAKDIVGKWHCSQAVTSQLNLGFEDVLCEYKFKKNGTFVLKISGETLMKNGKYTHDYNHLRRGLIVVKGLYKLSDGLITTTVENEDVECFAEETEDYIDDTDRTPASLYVARNNKEASYKKNKALLLRKSLFEYRFLWDWDNETVTIIEKEMSIGDQLKCVR